MDDKSNPDTKENWWMPTNLTKSEENFRKINNINELDTRNDFGSYRKVLLTNKIEGTQLESHNDLSPKDKVYLISKVIKSATSLSILDAGCGMGFTTEAIAENYPNASVLGIDVSEDAIDFASKKHKKATFRSQSISPEDKDLGKFDVIFCFEFYPFTRNNNSEIQSSFINYFSRQLNNDGEIVIYQKWENELSLSAVLSDVKKKCLELNFKIINIPHPLIFKYVPNIISAKAISFLLGIITGKKLIKKILVITKS